MRMKYEFFRGLLHLFECQVELISDWNDIYHIKITHGLMMQHFTLLITHSYDDTYEIVKRIMKCFAENRINNIINDAKRVNGHTNH